MIILRPNNKLHVSSSLSGSFSGSFQGSVLSSNAQLSGSFNGSFNGDASLTGSFSGSFIGISDHLDGDFSGSIGIGQSSAANELNGDFFGNFTGDGKDVINIIDRVQIGSDTSTMIPVKSTGIISFSIPAANNAQSGITVTPLPDAGSGPLLFHTLSEIPNTALANSTISGRALGSNLENLIVTNFLGLEINTSPGEDFQNGIATGGTYNGQQQKYAHFNGIRIADGTPQTSADRLLMHDVNTGASNETCCDIGNPSNSNSLLRLITFSGTGLEADYTNAGSGIVTIRRKPNVTYLTNIYSQPISSTLFAGRSAGDQRARIGSNSVRFFNDNNSFVLGVETTFVRFQDPLHMNSNNIRSIGTLDEVSADLVSFTNVLGAWQGKGNSGNAPTYAGSSFRLDRVEGIPQMIYGEWNGPAGIQQNNAMPLGNGSYESNFVFPLAGQILQITISYYANGNGGDSVSPIVLEINGSNVASTGTIDTSTQGTGHQTYALAEPASPTAWDFAAGDRAKFKLGNVSSNGMNISTTVAVVACIWYAFE